MLSDRRPPLAPPRPERRWQLLQDGVPVCTVGEEALMGKIREGEVLCGSVRPIGEAEWRDIKSHPPFASALREAMTTVSLRKR
jgi:hypothetical protein